MSPIPRYPKLGMMDYEELWAAAEQALRDLDDASEKSETKSYGRILLREFFARVNFNRGTSK